MSIRTWIPAVFTVAALGSASHAIVLSGGSGHRAASVEFTVSGSRLYVELTNTSTQDVMQPTDVLTGVFFRTVGDHDFNPFAATLCRDSRVFFGPDGGGNLGGEWAYRDDLSGAPMGMTHGISSSGLGLFGPHDLFGGPNLEGPLSPDGLNYGITSFGDDLTTGNSSVTGRVPLIKNSVCFTFDCAAGFDPSTITHAYFQYGTSLDEPGFEAPAPGALTLLGLGGALARRRRR
jgi:MYXO-CTERM domain-containing protein